MGCSASHSDPQVDKPHRLLSGHYRKFKQFYIMGKNVGHGAFAQVRLCQHISSGDERVVKIISKPYSQADFELEVFLLRTVGDGKCENVVKFSDYFEDDRFYYCIMEYCKGGDLIDCGTAWSNFSDVTLALWVKQVLKGIAHIHSLGIVHRDIKAQNLIFQDETCTTLKIVDFGLFKGLTVCIRLSYPMTKRQLLDEPCGTPEFLSPEMILGRYGRKVDVWAVGVLCYIYLFGTRPFLSSTDPELFREIVETEPSYAPAASSGYTPSPSAISFCKMLLQKNFRLRPTAAEALGHPWISSADPKYSVYQDYSRSTQTIEGEIIPKGIRRMARQETLDIGKRCDERTQTTLKAVGSKRTSVGLELGNPEKRTVLGGGNQQKRQFSILTAVSKQKTGTLEPGRNVNRKLTRVNVEQYMDVYKDIDKFRAAESFNIAQYTDTKSVVRGERVTHLRSPDARSYKQGYAPDIRPRLLWSIRNSKQQKANSTDHRHDVEEKPKATSVGTAPKDLLWSNVVESDKNLKNKFSFHGGLVTCSSDSIAETPGLITF